MITSRAISLHPHKKPTITQRTPHKNQHMKSYCDTNNNTKRLKIAVIGAGVVGISVARCFALRGFDVVLVEKSDTVLDSPASSGNSGILHCGFDAKPKSVEKRCLKNGRRLLEALMEVLDGELPIDKKGALMVAWNEEELKQLSAVKMRAIENGIKNIRTLSPLEVRELEPNISDYLEITGGILVPDEWVVDPWLLPMLYLANALKLGIDLRLSHVVNDLNFDEEKSVWSVECNNQDGKTTIHADYVINCAGLYGDYIQEILSRDESPFVIKPKKGQFLVLNTGGNVLVQNIILPVPLEDTKGLLLWHSYYDHLIIGPTYEEQLDRDQAQHSEDKETFLNEQVEIMLEGVGDIVTEKIAYGGLRPATQDKDYQIMGDEERKYFTVGGIRSTGFSAALGIAEYVFSVWTHLFVEKVYEGTASEEDIKESLRDLKNSIKNMDANNEILLYGHKIRVTHPITKYAIKTGKFFDKQKLD